VGIGFYGHEMSDENGVPENSEDEAAAAGYVVGNGKLPIGTSELEQEIKELENLLRLEREERRRIQAEAQDEMDRELHTIEERWMERTRNTMQERDTLLQKLQQLEEQVDSLRADLNRAVAYRLEVEESRNRMKNQLESVQRDYEETMAERSSVLEENTRMGEERDRLKQTVHALSRTLNELRGRTQNEEDFQNISNRLEHTRLLLHLNMEETASAKEKRTEALEKLERLRVECARLAEERDAAVREARAADVERNEALHRLRELECEKEPITDLWNTHTIEVALPYPKPNLGIVLSGGRTDDRCSIPAPIYVKDVLIGSPLENMLKRLDHILMVNDIDVMEMDQRSVIDILKNSHHLKMLIRRRANASSIHEVTFTSNHDIGIELGNGVFVNAVNAGGLASRVGVEPGHRIVHVNNVPVYDAKHAEQLIRCGSGQVVVGLLDGKKRPDPYGKDQSKQKVTLFSKIFGRQSVDKPRVVAKANIGNTSGEPAFLRQGSLRIPSQQHVSPELVRYGSLRAPQGSAEHAKIVEQLDHFLNKNHSLRSSVICEATGSTWPKSMQMVEEQAAAVPPRRRLHRPSVFPVFAPQNHHGNARLARQPSEVSSTRCGCSSPSSAWSPRSTRDSYPSDGRLPENRMIKSPAPTTASFTHAHRVSAYSPALPQPPPYPGPREESISSLISSTNSIPHPSTSSVHISYHNQANNSPSGTLLSETSDRVRRVCLSKEGNEFGLGLENSNGGVVISNVPGRANGLVRRGDRLLDVGGINMRSADKDAASKVLTQFCVTQDEVTLLVSGSSNPRWVTVPRKSVRLCGGNAMGILSEAAAGELQEGDLILEIDGYNVRGATLEEATEALLESLSEMAELHVEDGGDRLNRLRLGADGDSFYVRINVDRNSENKDELDIKAGEIVFVDNTMFMGQRGKWRAWKVDREGRQRENGIIPSATHMERSDMRGKKAKNRISLTRPICERVERVSSSKRRPIVLFGPLLTPFIQTLLDDSSKFSHCVPECRALQSMEVDRLLASCELIEARRRETLYDVITAPAIQHFAEMGIHCIVDVSPSGIQRLHSLRIYPIVIRIKFKSAKQIKDVKEDCCGEKITTKQAKDLIDRASAVEKELEAMNCSASVLMVSSQGPSKGVVKHVCQQIVTLIDHEQKKTIWMTIPQ
uniref:PDZ domain-containing protein n=1 Tax=Haemonchus contortus TaxID=6289 RepID=A0A7I4YPR4_HAECO